MGRLFNSAILIDDRGQILLKHRQVNIPQKLMSPPYAAGAESDIATVNTKFGKIGLLICADTHRQDILDRMAALKPNLLLVPYGYAEDEQKWPAHSEEFHNVVINAAKRTGAAVIGNKFHVGRISRGPWAGRVYGGHSIAVDKTGQYNRYCQRPRQRRKNCADNRDSLSTLPVRRRIIYNLSD